jgi:prephenate dehydrogenase
MKIAIIGLGVIGGSLGLAIKQNDPQATIAGFDSPGIMRRARKRRAIDISASSLRAAVSDAEIVFLCTPVDSILRLLPDVSRYISSTAIVTDVGSVKGVVQACAKSYFGSHGIFIGGHPMAGSEGSGIEYADGLLFQNAVYVLCPPLGRAKETRFLAALLKSIGARVLTMSAREHDRVAAAISHLPQLIAVSLMDSTAHKNKRNPAFLQLAAGGFRDMTRIASSPFDIWKDILSNNRDETGRALQEFEKMLALLRKGLHQRSLSDVGRKFLRAKSFRDSIPKNTKGFLHSLHDLFIWVDDKPGTLAKMTAVLFRSGININDIELLKVREGQGGTFRLSFESNETARLASKTLRAKGFRVAK